MSKQRTKLIGLALVGACTFGVYAAAGALFGDDEQATKHAVNQLWIDHVPHDDRDMIFHMVLIDHRDGQFGAFGQSSQWRHRIEVFRWQLQADTLGMYFPQDRVRGNVKVKTWDCRGDAPAPFELCMRLTNDEGRSVTLYSREDWKIQPRDVQDSIADIIEDAPELTGLFDGTPHEIGAGAFVEFDEAQDWPLTQPF